MSKRKQVVSATDEGESDDEPIFPKDPTAAGGRQTLFVDASPPKPAKRKKIMAASDMDRNISATFKNLFPIMPQDVPYYLSIDGAEAIEEEECILQYRNWDDKTSRNKVGSWKEAEEVLRWICGTDSDKALLEGNTDSDNDDDLAEASMLRLIKKQMEGEDETDEDGAPQSSTHLLDKRALRMVEGLLLNSKVQGMRQYCGVIYTKQYIRRGLWLLQNKYPSWAYCLQELHKYRMKLLESTTMAMKYSVNQRPFITWCRLDADARKQAGNPEVYKELTETKDALVAHLQELMFQNARVALKYKEKQKKKNVRKQKSKKVAVEVTEEPEDVIQMEADAEGSEED